MTPKPNPAMLAALDKALATFSDVDGWNFLCTYGQELRKLVADSGEVAWSCTQQRPDDGGFWTDTKYARTQQEMVILRDQGYACTPISEPGLNPVREDGIHADMEARYERERARFRTVVSLMGEPDAAVDAAMNKLNAAIATHPDGTLVLTHGPFNMPSEKPETSFRNLIAMSWQDDDYGSQYYDLLWERP